MKGKIMTYFRCLLIICLGIVTVAGCSYERLEPSFKSEDTFTTDGNLQSTPNFAQFREIPVPE